MDEKMIMVSYEEIDLPHGWSIKSQLNADDLKEMRGLRDFLEESFIKTSENIAYLDPKNRKKLRLLIEKADKTHKYLEFVEKLLGVTNTEANGEDDG